MSRAGVMHHTRANVDERDVFVHGSFYFANFRAITFACCCSAAAGAGDRGVKIGDRKDGCKRRVHNGLDDQRCCWRRREEVVQVWMRVWERAEFWAWYKVM